MKAVIVKEFGDAENLEHVTLPDPQPKPDEVIIDVEACGVGHADILMRKGAYFDKTAPGFSPGVDVAGVVSKIGVNVDTRWLGKRVMAVLDGGGYAEKARIQGSRLIPVPDNVPLQEAAALGVNAVTGLLALRHARVQKGERVLVRGASGGLGLAVLQIAEFLGCATVASTSSPAHATRLERLGFNVQVGTKAAGRSRYDVVFDPVLGPDATHFLDRLNAGGRYLLCGAAGGMPGSDLLASFLVRFSQSLSFMMFSLKSMEAGSVVEAGEELFRLHQEGALAPHVHDVLPIEQARKAHNLLESRQVFGKVLLCP